MSDQQKAAQLAMAQAAALHPGVNTLGGRVDKAPTPMQEHMTSLECHISHLERMQLQLDNMLDQVRGAMPRAEGDEKVSHPPGSLIDHLRQADDRINLLCNSINAQLDELNGLF